MVKTELKTDRDVFYRDERVKKVVSTLLNDNTEICFEVMRLINFAHTLDAFEKRIFKIGDRSAL